MVKQLTLQAGEGKYSVILMATLTGEGIILQLFGGEKPHIGAVILSLPRPSHKNPEQISCTSTVVPLLGHKDDEIAKPAAEKVVRSCGLPVVVIAGLHIEKASEQDISLLKENAAQVVGDFLKTIGSSA